MEIDITQSAESYSTCPQIIGEKMFAVHRCPLHNQFDKRMHIPTYVHMEACVRGILYINKYIHVRTYVRFVSF